MAFRQRCCNWVFQPPTQLRHGGIYSRRPSGLRCWPGGPAAPLWRSTPGANPRASLPDGWNEGYELAILWGGASADCPGLPSPTWQVGPATLGPGPAWLGAERAADVAESTGGLAYRVLRGEFIQAIGRVIRIRRGSTGDHPGLDSPYPTCPTNCLARTRSTGCWRGSALSCARIWRQP